MSISTDLLLHFDNDVSEVKVTKTDLHGEDATEVVAYLRDGRSVTGTFAKHPRSGFGGVQFAGPKDVVALMTAKIQSVLDGTYEA